MYRSLIVSSVQSIEHNPEQNLFCNNQVEIFLSLSYLFTFSAWWFYKVVFVVTSELFQNDVRCTYKITEFEMYCGRVCLYKAYIFLTSNDEIGSGKRFLKWALFSLAADTFQFPLPVVNFWTLYLMKLPHTVSRSTSITMYASSNSEVTSIAPIWQ